MTPTPTPDELREIENLLYEHDPMCGHDDCRNTARKIAAPLKNIFAKSFDDPAIAIEQLLAERERLAGENARLRGRLEIPEPPFEAYDGIDCRNETIKGLEASRETIWGTLKNAEADFATAQSRIAALEGALRKIAENDSDGLHMFTPQAMQATARAVLGEREGA